MFNEFKKLKLEELERERMIIDELEKLLNEEEILKQIIKKNKELIKKPSNSYNLIEKYLIKRKKYKETLFTERSILNGEEKLKQIIAIRKEKYDDIDPDLTLKQIDEEISKLKDNRAFDYSVDEVIAYLERKNITPILTKEEIRNHYKDEEYTDTSSLVLVHLSKHPPTDNTIRTAKNSKARTKNIIKIQDKIHEIYFNKERNTVHFCVNSPVGDHAYGSWSNCKYAVIIPFDDIPKEQIKEALSVDTFTEGDVVLTENSWIICPQEEVEKIRQLNPKIKVLGYNTKDIKQLEDGLKELISSFIEQLGYHLESAGAWGWINDKNNHKFDELMKKEGFSTNPHTITSYSRDEKMLGQINRVVAAIKFIIENNTISTYEEFQKIMQELNSSQLSTFNLSGLYNFFEEDKNNPNAVMGNKRQAGIFISKMEENGLYISPSFQKVILRLCQISIMNCNQENMEYIFEVSPDMKQQEREIIEKLKKDFENPSQDRRNIMDEFHNYVIYTAIKNYQKEIQEENKKSL